MNTAVLSRFNAHRKKVGRSSIRETIVFSKLLTSLLVVVLLVPTAHACTAFVVYRNGLALAGNNEDFWLTDTKIWYVPKEGSKRGVAGKLGRVYFGFDNFYPQGGMNEAGLFFDGFATAENKIKKSTASRDLTATLPTM